MNRRIEERESGDKARIASIHWSHLTAAWRKLGWWDEQAFTPERRLAVTERILIERYNHDEAARAAFLDAYRTSDTPAPQDRELTPRLVVERYWPAEQRKSRGAFMTPQTLADRLCDLVLETLGGMASPLPSMLDAAAGTGTLALTLLNRLAAHAAEPSRATLYAEACQRFTLEEVDPVLYRAALARWLRNGLALLEREAPAQPCLLPVHHVDSFTQRQSHGLILSNPPYLGEKRGRSVLQSLAALRPRLVARRHGKSDLLYFFMQHLLDRLEPDGTMALLTPSYWPTADGAKILRTEILRQLTLHRLEFLPLGAFGNQANVHGMLLIGRKHHGVAQHRPLLVIDGHETPAAVEQNRWTEGPWPVRLGPLHATTVETMQDWPHCLGDFFAVRAGVQTGADRYTKEHKRHFDLQAEVGEGIFVLSDEERTRLWPSLSKAEQELIVPLAKCHSIRPGRLEPSKHPAHLIYLDGSRDIATLPALREHLERFRPILERRREVGLNRMPWWRLHWPRQRELFEEPHLVCPQRASIPVFAVTDKPLYSSVDVYHLSPIHEAGRDLQAWLRYLLSEPVALWLSLMGKRKGAALELYSTPLQAIPVPPKGSENSPLG